MPDPLAILIGDSIRLSYQGVVARGLEGTAHVWGPEANCGTTRAILGHLDPWILSRAEPGAVVHLNAGLHDLRRLPEPERAPTVPIEEYAANLRTIVDAVAGAGLSLLLATTTPVDDVRHRAAGRWERAEADVVAYNAALSGVAAASTTPVVDLYARVAADRNRLLGDDGVHLSPEGAVRVGEAVAAAVRRQLGAG